MDAAAWAAIGTWFTAAIYVVLLVFAVKQVGEAQRLRRAQTRPFVVVDIAPGFILYVTVENIGSTLARNVRFKFPVQPQSSMEGATEIVESPLFRDGVPVLPPEKRYRFFFDSFTSRVNRADLPMSYEVIVSYEDDDGMRYSDLYVLDMNSFMHSAPDEHGLPELVEAVNKIRKRLDTWTDGTRGLLVHARDKDSMIREDRERWEARRAQLESEASADSAEGGEPKSD